MSEPIDNVWMSELDANENVWGNDHDDSTTQSSPSIDTAGSSTNSLPHEESSVGLQGEETASRSVVDIRSTDSSPNENIEATPIKSIDQSIDNNDNVWDDVAVTDIPHKLEEQIVIASKHEETEISADEELDDDFGDFEEMKKESLIFDRPVVDLLNSIFPTIYETDETLKENIDKSSLLNEGGIRPMKCYNTITASNRQYMSDEIPVLNTRQRGCIEKMELHKVVLGIVGEWMCDDKGIYKKEDNEAAKSSWKGINKNGIFRWSTKTESEPKLEKEKSVNFSINDRKLVGQKLLNSSFEQARRIIEERSESEKKEKMLLEKARWEREQTLKKEKLKKEEELEKYNVEHVKIDDKKKKGFFGKMFAGKSKIAKDHLSHKKVVQLDDDNTDKGELSLIEQMERDGYDLSQSKSKKKRSKAKRKGGGGKKATNDDDDDDDNDDDGEEEEYDDDVLFDNNNNGYDVLNPNSTTGTVENELSSEDEEVELEEDEEREESSTVVKERDGTSNVDSNIHSLHARDFNKEVPEVEGDNVVVLVDDSNETGENVNDSGDEDDDSDQETFDDFQTPGIPLAVKPDVPMSSSGQENNLIDL